MNKLPEVHLKVIGHTFLAHSKRTDDLKWRIYAEAEDEVSARTKIKLDNKVIADITVHAKHYLELVKETQEVSAALLWSAIMSKYIKKCVGK